MLVGSTAFAAITCSNMGSDQLEVEHLFCLDNIFAACEEMDRVIKEIERRNDIWDITIPVVNGTAQTGLAYICAGACLGDGTDIMFPHEDVKVMLYQGEFEDCKVAPIVTGDTTVYWGVHCPVRPFNETNQERVKEEITAVLESYEEGMSTE